MRKNFLILLILFTLTFSFTGVMAEDLVSGDYLYTVLADGTAEILSYQGEEPDITVPDTIEGLKVTSIAAMAFSRDKTLSSVVIPEGVTALGDNVFGEDTALVSVTLPDGLLTMGDLVFQGCTSLEKADLPASLVHIGDNPFDRCDRISGVVLPEDHPFYTVTDGVLFDRRSAKLISYPTGKPDRSYSVPEWVTTIGLAGFSENSHLQELTLPDGLSELEGNPFCGCTSLKNIEVSKTHSVYEVKENALFNKQRAELIAYLWGIDHPVYNIPAGTVSLAQESFYKHAELTVVYLPSSVNAIGMAAFAESGLESITLPQGVVRLEDSLFSNCTHLKSVSLPGKLVSIGQSVFYGCTYLRRIDLPSSLRTIGAGAFYLCQSLTKVTVPEGVESIGNYAFAGCYYLNTITLPKSLVSIGRDIFYGDESVTVDAPKGSFAEEWADANGILHGQEPVDFVHTESI